MPALKQRPKQTLASRPGAKRKIRYAVVGLGYIAQIAVLPAFAHTGKNSELVALVSDDPLKLKQLSKKYKVANTYSYEQYDACLKGGEIDAVYIALPNNMHREYTERAAHAGIHVLCEKPMAVTVKECEAMIKATEQNRVKLMIAYRLHFEEANLKAAEIVQSGKIGEPRFFSSLFAQQIKAGDIRLQKALGGGTLYDMGIYCINAARYLFHDEPTEVFAYSANNGDERFSEVEEMTCVIMRFPNQRLAQFVSGFGSADVSMYQVVGTKGGLRLDPGYEIAAELTHRLTIGGKIRKRVFARRDQFAPELLYFSNCVLNDETPEPSGKEGLADVRIIAALYQSIKTGKPVKLDTFQRKRRPTLQQESKSPPIEKPELIHAETPTGN
ncbi:MAG: Gfo/Idh/MocA family oxidoreductase [Burkholderiales bacterium]|nr:Gfo/Idh/MocA family oxidoreductase [Burkholderiales bacterium]